MAPALSGGLDARQRLDTGQDRPGLDDPGAVLRGAVALADEGELDRAGTILSHALDRWPEHPGLIAGLAGLLVRQGRLAEAEVLADRLVRIDPSSDHGWELLAASRYLQDDT
ncbi:MAG TPA: tetratricopeptide repeat protein, partial [Longimicrobiales bacterium]|nr:tetratricopeptide repeat protein [Longimicrobiales bacterium]